MKLLKQRHTLRITNFDGPSENRIHKHGPLLPFSIRCLICGPSNCGKTNLLLSLLYDPSGLKFQNIYLFSKSLYQPKYKHLEAVLKDSGVGYFPFESNNDIPDPAETLPNSVIIFDDVACDKQDVIRTYFCMGRHSGIDSFYLCQSYARVPKHLIRDNVNLIILFKQDELNLKRIYSDHVNSDMEFNQFKRMCTVCWSQSRYGFLVIDKDCELDSGRYRKGFDTYIVV